MRKFLQTTLIVVTFLCNVRGQGRESYNTEERIKAILTEQTHSFVRNEQPLHHFAIEQNSLHIYLNANKSIAKTTWLENAYEHLIVLAHQLQLTSCQFFILDNNNWINTNSINTEEPQLLYQNPINHDRTELENRNGFPTSQGNLPIGSLTNKTVWLSPGHGWFNDDGGAWTTQRGTTNGMVEDFGSIEGVDYYLQHYLRNAGANVWLVRERDVQRQEIIVNNDAGSPSYTETGVWTNGSVSGYGGTYRTVNTASTETATAIFKPTITVSGLYWVSVRYIAGTNRTVDAKFRITHAGGVTTQSINQEIHGDTWVYLGQYYFFANDVNNKVVISNQSSDVGQALIADAVRFGGGYGTLPDCTFTGDGISGKTKYDESARQYAIFQGYPTCRNDVTMRPFYAEWELAKGTPTEQANAVYVSWHSNAFDGTARGTTVYSYDGTGTPPITPGSPELRNYIHNTLIADIRAQWDPAWQNRGVNTANFGELRELTTMPGCLAEVAFHDNATDASYIKNPEFKRTLARAIYKGIVKFFNWRDGSPITFEPEIPSHLVAKRSGTNSITLTWNAPLDNTTNVAYGNSASGYKYYISENGKGFDNGTTTTGTSVTINSLDLNKIYYFKVTATNSGGESFPTNVIACKIGTSTTNRYLIVDGFDRLDASGNIDQYESAALGTVKRSFVERINNYDYIIAHASSLANCTSNISFDGAENEAVISGSVLLSNYASVDWFVGEESTADRSFDATEQTLIQNYLNAGGNLLVSGSEIGWDIGRAASANASVSFYNNYFKTSYVGDDAGTFDMSGSNIFTGINTNFANTSTEGYVVDFPDRVSTFGGSVIAGSYVGGTADGAAIQYAGTFKTVYVGYPIEMIMNSTQRDALLCKVVEFFTPTLLKVDWSRISAKNLNKSNEIILENYNEENVRTVEIQRSKNGIEFETVSTFAGQNKNAINFYSALDNEPYIKTYYRAVTIDNDGKKSISNIIVIINKQTNEFSLYPNPVHSIITIENKGDIIDEDISLNIVDVTGKLIESQTISSFRNQYNYDVSNLSNGIYFIHIKRQNELTILKFFKK